MNTPAIDNDINAAPAAGASMMDLARRLYPIPRSLTGRGVRRTLSILKETFADIAGIQIFELPTGQPVFDWRVPQEWNLKKAWIEDESGRRIIDTDNHNLHVVGYSEPVDRTLSLAELQPHLHSLPDRPDWIPYRTTYYKRDWGICLTHRQRETLAPGNYRVVIDATLADGCLTFGEVHLPGETDQDILVSTHVCHPSLANDNLSGLVVATAMIRALAARRGRYGVRVLFIPATIGAVAWLATRPEQARQIAHGLVLSNLGDSGGFHYKQTYAGTAEVDQVFEHLFAATSQHRGEIMPYTPYGYDERQFNSPGIRAPVGSLMRSPFGTYPQYHTSADDLSFISEPSLQESLDVCLATVAMLQANRRFANLAPMGEPQLGKRGLYDAVGGANQTREDQLALLWVLAMSDRSNSLLDIARRAQMPFERISGAARALERAGLLQAI